MANPLEYVTAHPKETKRMLGISYQVRLRGKRYPVVMKVICGASQV